ncbi:MAG: hypothetical protein KAI17_03415 [Thiotrichaceae bacterium]|nr:hypothetical protein [Thiotrichaceae bacterium]
MKTKAIISQRTIKIPTCPYCGTLSELCTINVFYGRPIKKGYLYVCRDYPECNSYVGCHPGTIRPLGSMANKELRTYRSELHALFDPQWKNAIPKQKVRSELYHWLAGELSLPVEKCHMAYFNLEEAKQALQICRAKFREKETIK